MIPIFSIALANSSGSTVPLLFRSKYLKAFIRTCSSLWLPADFCESFLSSSFSKLQTVGYDQEIP
jgi:hypothetical protein